MKISVKELSDELQRLEKCDEVLLRLLYHHISQHKNPALCTKNYHLELCKTINEARGIK
jgi:hypothetical protein